MCGCLLCPTPLLQITTYECSSDTFVRHHGEAAARAYLKAAHEGIHHQKASAPPRRGAGEGRGWDCSECLVACAGPLLWPGVLHGLWQALAKVALADPERQLRCHGSLYLASPGEVWRMCVRVCERAAQYEGSTWRKVCAASLSVRVPHHPPPPWASPGGRPGGGIPVVVQAWV